MPLWASYLGPRILCATVFGSMDSLGNYDGVSKWQPDRQHAEGANSPKHGAVPFHLQLHLNQHSTSLYVAFFGLQYRIRGTWPFWALMQDIHGTWPTWEYTPQ